MHQPNENERHASCFALKLLILLLLLCRVFFQQTWIEQIAELLLLLLFVFCEMNECALVTLNRLLGRSYYISLWYIVVQ